MSIGTAKFRTMLVDAMMLSGGRQSDGAAEQSGGHS